MTQIGDRKKFRRIAGAGIAFQGGSAAVDSATIIAGFVYTLTGSAIAVGLASASLRLGWLLPQLFVGYLAQRSQRRMPFYILGAFGRASCLALLACAIWIMGDASRVSLTLIFFVLWIGYAFISGIVAVPYNDIVGRSIPSDRRSRLLAWRFFGGGLLGLAVAAAAFRLQSDTSFPFGHAAIFGLAALLMFASSFLFVSAGEPKTIKTADEQPAGFFVYLREGLRTYREDRRFRLFLYSQWLGGAALMALPFYVIHAQLRGLDLLDIPLMLAAQTGGALVSNALWGYWGDQRGKQRLLERVAILRLFPPLAALALPALLDGTPGAGLVVSGSIFFVLGALMNGTTIAMLGYLMEISPDDRRPAYSGYFNVLVAPVSLLPIVGGIIADALSLRGVFVVAAIAAMVQLIMVRQLRENGPGK